MGQGCGGVKQQGGKTQLHQCGRGFMGQLCQSQARDESQHCTIGNGAGVILGASFAAKSKGHRLRQRAAGQVITAVPGGHECQHQQTHERKACRQIRR